MKKRLLVFWIILSSLILIEQHLLNQGLPESWIKIYKRCYQSCLENCQNKKFCNRHCTFEADEQYYREAGIKIKE